MTQRLSRASRRGHAGFTLIELLVVIIILGVLAAVVVFAVSGADDKGKAAAASIDERTIRTAQEAFCARTGQYGTTQQLVEAGLLANPPVYTGVWIDSPGPCGSTRYQTFSTKFDSIAGLSGTTCEPGIFCEADRANGTSTTTNNRQPNTSVPTLLPDGRVLLEKGNIGLVSPWQIFDPDDGALGTWSPMADPSSTPATTANDAVPNTVSNGLSSPYYQPIVIKGDATWCGTNCGKVLVHFRAQESQPVTDVIPWRLYDPNTSVDGTASAGHWEDLDARSVAADGPYRRVFAPGVVQFTRQPCGANCGKVLIVGGGAEDTFGSPLTPEAEIWDPLTEEFRRLGVGNGYISGAIYSATLLPSGEVFLLSDTSAQIFDPVTEQIRTVTPAPLRHRNSVDRAVLLADGSVLATTEVESAANRRIMIYRPLTDQWEDHPYCGPASCSVLSLFADGKVLAKTAAGASNVTIALRIFDPTTNIWSSTPSAPLGSMRWAITLKETMTGSCDDLCNRVLVIGTATTGTTGGRVNIYTP